MTTEFDSVAFFCKILFFGCLIYANDISNPFHIITDRLGAVLSESVESVVWDWLSFFRECDVLRPVRTVHLATIFVKRKNR